MKNKLYNDYIVDVQYFYLKYPDINLKQIPDFINKQKAKMSELDFAHWMQKNNVRKR